MRSDTAMFDLNIEKTHKRGRPRKRGKRIDYHNLEYKKDDKFFVVHIKVAVNLIDTRVYITITNLSTTIFIKYKFQSPQEVKYHLSECIYKEFIFSKLLKTLQLDKNITTAEDIFKYLADSDKAS